MAPAASYFDPQTNISMPLASVWSKIVAMPMPTLPCSAKARRTLCPAGQDRARLPGHGLIILGPCSCLLVLANLLCLSLSDSRYLRMDMGQAGGQLERANPNGRLVRSTLSLSLSRPIAMSPHLVVPPYRRPYWLRAEDCLSSCMRGRGQRRRHRRGLRVDHDSRGVRDSDHFSIQN